MFDFKEINKSEEIINKKLKKKKSKADEIYKEALKRIDVFKNERNEDDLKIAAKLFFEVIKIDRKKIEAYVWLSYIFYITDKDKLCIKYLKLAEELDKNHDKLKELKLLISGSNSEETEEIENETKYSFSYNFFGLENESLLKKLKILFNLYKDKIHFSIKVKNKNLFKQGVSDE
ncbi:MAG: hypothetical protein KatS3mg068_0371 [Candidatus Sericytochromatia bacterium]|nr:MAG: hypothetical protein KatS3mg068_0371 [Candidatus Sericytochromatia bacterium]